MPRLMVLGHARHGKDMFAHMLCNANKGLTFASSSYFAAELFLFEELRGKYLYETPRECYLDRHKHRGEWHRAIARYNANDGARMAKALYKKYDIYVGMRSRSELSACFEQNVIDAVYWVDAGGRKPLESSESMKLSWGYVSTHPARRCPLLRVDNSREGKHNMRILRNVQDEAIQRYDIL